MIDFPASPTDGQIFSATNGVVYKYSATYSSWLAQNPTPPLGGTGDFCANQTSSFPTLTNAFTTLILTQIYSGNSGLWYSTSTGRYTPPAGRFFISAGMSGTGTTGATLALQLRKNGTVLLVDYDSQAAAGAQANPKLELIVDANGTDWFDIQGLWGSGTPSLYNIVFQAFPLTGMQGPTGGAPGPVVGDVSAYNTTTITLPTSFQTIALTGIRSGNSGGWYSAGRYTPPAGRYFIIASISANNATAMAVLSQLTKNGTQITYGVSSAAANGAWGSTTVEATVDANGTDWFEFQAYSTVANSTTAINNVLFTAFPTQGMVGPQGPPGVISNGFRLINRVVPTAGQATVDFTGLPSDINDLQLNFDVTPQTNQVDIYLQMFDNTGVIDNASHYTYAVSVASWSQASGTSSPAVGNPSGALFSAIVLEFSAANRAVGSAGGIRGRLSIPNIRDAARGKGVDFQNSYLSSDGTQWLFVTGGGIRTVTGAITGLRLSWGSGNFAAGGAVSLWGSP